MKLANVISLFLSLSTTSTTVAQRDDEKKRHVRHFPGNLSKNTNDFPKLIAPEESPSVAVIEGVYLVVLDVDVVDIEGKMKDLIKATSEESPGMTIEALGGVWNINNSFKGQPLKMTQEQAQAMSLMDDVKFIEPDTSFKVMLPPPPEDGEIDEVIQPDPSSWGLDRIDQKNLPLDDQYEYVFDGSGVTVYVMDSGVLTTHDEFTDRIVSSPRFANGPEACNHGTHVAGTVGGTKFGVAKGVNLVNVEMLSCLSRGDVKVQKVLDAYHWIGADADASTTTRKVINASFGCADCTGSVAETNAIAALVDSGVVFVAAAGNSGGNNDPPLRDNIAACDFFPASHPDVITVGASSITDGVARFSSFGECVDILAPGVTILSASNSTDTATATLQGTSMASPHVAGVAALILQQDPALTPAQVKTELIRRSTKNVLAPDNLRGAPNRLLFALDDRVTTTTTTAASTTTTASTSTATTSTTTTNSKSAKKGKAGKSSNPKSSKRSREPM